MARLLAVDWDQREVRYVLANAHSQHLDVAAVGTKTAPSDGEESDQRAATMGAWLREELRRHKWSRPETLVGLDRANIELLHLDLPPAQDDELPEMVRNQALRQSALVTDDSLLDFVAAPTDSDDRRVTAMALSHAALDTIQATCAAAGVSPKRMLVRPYAAASLFTRLATPSDAPCLLISRFAEEADLAVVHRGTVVFWRTVQLPTGAGGQGGATEALLAEVRRTLMVVQNQIGGDPIQHLSIFGDETTHRELAEKLVAELGLEAEVVEPFAAAPEYTDEVPGDSGRYAALLGMLLDEAENRAPAIDFLHPRRKPPPPNRRRVMAIAGVLGAVIFLGIVYTIWGRFAVLEDKRQQLAQRAAQLDKLVKKAAKQERIVNAVRDWKRGDVILLDELRDLSLRLPKARDMVVLGLTKSPARNGLITITFKGLVRDPEVIRRMIRSLDDEYHNVLSPSGQGLRPGEFYTWRFDSSITVAPRDKSEYLRYLPRHLVPQREVKPPRPEPPTIRPKSSPTPPPPKPPGAVS